MANSEKKSNTIPKHTDFLELFFQDGILYCIYKEIDFLDLSIATTCVQDRLDYIGNTSYPSLFDITKIKHSTKEARDYLANEGNDGVLASAILISSPMLKMSANFYIKVNKPQNPTRMFTDRQSAVEWLKQFKK